MTLLLCRPKRFPILLLVAVCASLWPAFPAGAAPPTCPVNPVVDAAKPNKLYLYFPEVVDPAFPPFDVQMFGVNYGVSPAQPFGPGGIGFSGDIADLRDAITQVVIDDYCEFNVQVIPTTVSPPTTSPRRVTVAIGTDVSSLSGLYGIANGVDLGDVQNVNYARVFGGQYQVSAGGAGGALNGTKSTLERWAFAIGGTTAHEAGHSYGLSHSGGQYLAATEDSLLLGPGETAVPLHIMPSGGLVDDEQRAGYRRHFNEWDFGVLAANVGLSVSTVHNWDFVNPNAAPATKLTIDVLSTETSLQISDPYLGTGSPWGPPSVTPAGTAPFNGLSYNKFEVTWSTPKSWVPGPNGKVPGGAMFHVGTGFAGTDFSTTDPVILTKVRLFGPAGNLLPLAPRLFAYDAGTLDLAGDFGIRLSNPSPAAGPLLLRDVTVYELPRVVSIDSMVSGARRLRSWDGTVVRPLSVDRPLVSMNPDCRSKPSSCVTAVPSSIRIPVGHLSEGRHVFERVQGNDCGPSADRAAAPPGVTSWLEVNECENNGFNLHLFPSTTVLVKATVIDPKVRHWNPKRKRYVVGPLESTLFFQAAGVHPDLNRNGVDDAIDIATGAARDADEDGVVDRSDSNVVPILDRMR
jgi:hypothetical protein